MQLRREGPYRQPAPARAAALDARRPLSHRVLAVGVAVAGVALLSLPVVALARQPFSFYATLVTGALAAWTAVLWVRIAFAAD